MEIVFYFFSAIAALCGGVFGWYQFTRSFHADKTQGAQERADYWEKKFMEMTQTAEEVITELREELRAHELADNTRERMVEALFWDRFGQKDAGHTCSCGMWTKFEEPQCTQCLGDTAKQIENHVERAMNVLEHFEPMTKVEPPKALQEGFRSWESRIRGLKLVRVDQVPGPWDKEDEEDA